MVLISDHDYPYLEGHVLLTNVLNEINSKMDKGPGSLNKSLEINAKLQSTMLDESQNPRKVAVSAEIREDLDETKIVFRNRIEHVLQRDDQLCEIEHKTERLSENCKPFRTPHVNWRCNIG